MDKSFNDEELSDIMKEIEALELDGMGGDDGPMESKAVMEELADMEEEKSIPVTSKKVPEVLQLERKHQPQESKTVAPASMKFKVQGEMNMELEFEIGGKTIMLEVSESGLCIQMDGGVSFNVPVSAHSVKKAV
jgi:hypothetical protein